MSHLIAIAAEGVCEVDVIAARGVGSVEIVDTIVVDIVAIGYGHGGGFMDEVGEVAVGEAAKLAEVEVVGSEGDSGGICVDGMDTGRGPKVVAVGGEEEAAVGFGIDGEGGGGEDVEMKLGIAGDAELLDDEAGAFVAEGNLVGTNVFKSEAIDIPLAHGVGWDDGVEDEGRGVGSGGEVSHLERLAVEVTIKTELEIVGIIHERQDEVVPLVGSGGEPHGVGAVGRNVVKAVALGGNPAGRKVIVVVFEVEAIGDGNGIGGDGE